MPSWLGPTSVLQETKTTLVSQNSLNTIPSTFHYLAQLGFAFIFFDKLLLLFIQMSTSVVLF